MNEKTWTRNTEWRESDPFVVRVFRGMGDGVNGLVQHIRSGERVPFEGLESLGGAMATMMRGSPAWPAEREATQGEDEDSPNDCDENPK